VALSTAQVLEHHLNAFAAADLAAMLGDYSEASFIIAPDGTAIRGLAAIKALFEAFFAGFSDRSARFSMGLTAVEDDVAFTH